MSERSEWRCAVLRGWTPEQAQALTPVAAVAWVDGDTLQDLRIRWVPVTTEDERNATEAWASRLMLADSDLPVEEFLAFHGDKEASGVVLCAVPGLAANPSGAADLLLDEIIASPLWEALADSWYATVDHKNEE